MGKLTLAKRTELIRKRTYVDAIETDVTIENEKGTQMKITL